MSIYSNMRWPVICSIESAEDTAIKRKHCKKSDNGRSVQNSCCLCCCTITTYRKLVDRIECRWSCFEMKRRVVWTSQEERQTKAVFGCSPMYESCTHCICPVIWRNLEKFTHEYTRTFRSVQLLQWRKWKDELVQNCKVFGLRMRGEAEAEHIMRRGQHNVQNSRRGQPGVNKFQDRICQKTSPGDFICLFIISFVFCMCRHLWSLRQYERGG